MAESKGLVAGLLDEHNRKADLAAFSQLVALGLSVLMTVAVVIPMAYQVYKSGQLSTQFVVVLSLWLGIAAGLGISDKVWGRLGSGKGK